VLKAPARLEVHGLLERSSRGVGYGCRGTQLRPACPGSAGGRARRKRDPAGTRSRRASRAKCPEPQIGRGGWVRGWRVRPRARRSAWSIVVLTILVPAFQVDAAVGHEAYHRRAR
jgi:hypothetical protein